MVNEDNIGEEVERAIESRDEARLKGLIITAMRLFLEDKTTKQHLDSVASTYLTLPIELKWKTDFEFSDPKLRYVLEELSAIEVVPDEQAKMNVKRFIAYLEGRDYEKMIGEHEEHKKAVEKKKNR